MLEAAIALARRGWHVFPVHGVRADRSCTCDVADCPSAGKHPVTANGQLDATCDLERVVLMWTAWPDANVGVALEPSGLMALDVDDRAGREAAVTKLQAAIAATGELPDTVQVVSGSGWHVYYRRPEGVELRGDYMGITIRGRNYVVAPPSAHRSGRSYAWEDGCSPDQVEVAELPPAWVAALSRPVTDVSAVGVPDEQDEPPWLRALPDDERARRMRSYVEAQDGERQGQDRASLCFIVATCAARGYAVRDADAVLAAMLEYGRRCEPPYADEAVRERVWNAYAQGHTPEWGALIERELLEERLHAVADAQHPRDELAERRTRRVPPPPAEGGGGDDADADQVEGAVRAGRAVAGDPTENALAWAVRFILERHTVDGTPTLRWWRGNWYEWAREDGCYREVEEKKLRALHYLAGLRTPKPVSAAIDALPAVPGVLISHHDLGEWVDGRAHDVAPLDVAVTRSGLVDLATGAVSPSSPGFFVTSTLGTEYSPSAPAPARWHRFLRELWPDEPDSVQALQEWFGYLLTPDTRQHKILLMIGPPRSGKGTIGRVLTALLGGDAAVADPTLDQLGTDFGPAPLIGKMAAIIGDAKIDGKSDVAQVTARLLSISGGDSQTINRKHRDAWTGYLSTRFIVMCNSLPRFVDEGGALANRMVVLQTTESFLGREDHGLDDALLAELPGILNWAIEGWRRLRARGHFAEPASSVEVKQELADLAAPVAAWAREALVSCDRADSVRADLAYAGYKNWARLHGLPEPSAAVFGRDLKAARNCPRLQLLRGNQRVWCYIGVRLAPEEAAARPTIPHVPS